MNESSVRIKDLSCFLLSDLIEEKIYH